MPDLTLEKLEECFSEMMLYLNRKSPIQFRQDVLDEEKRERRWREYAGMTPVQRLAWWDNIKLKEYCQKRLDFYWSRKLGIT